MAQNYNTYCLNAAAVTARDAEYTGTPFTDTAGDGTTANPYLGGNRAGSCAPGIGINTANIDPKLDDWTTADQHAAARTPQDSQHIGGSGLGAGTEYLTTETPIATVVGADVNDTLSFIVAAAQAAPGVGFGPANANPINRTDVTIEIGDRAWGTDTTA